MQHLAPATSPASTPPVVARLRRLIAPTLLLFLLSFAAAQSPPLTQLDYTVTGQQLQVTPAALAVPKGIPGSFLATVLAGGEEATAEGTYVEATLRGPSFPARRIIGQAGTPILLPPLNLVGDYSLDNIRLVDSTTNATILPGSPSSIPIRVFDEVLIARVTSRPLNTEEILQRGIVIDENNFRAVEFEVGFVVDGKTIPVKFPVVAPAFYGNTEIIPSAEIEARLAQAELINESLTVGLPPELEASGLEIEVKGLNIQFVDPGSETDLALSVPPIAGLVVIPGKIGFLNQFFSVQVFVENAAPTASGLSVTDITAELVLPPGDDRIPAATYENPGDDPLRFARVGQNAVIQNVLPVTRAGADGVFGTPDDNPRLQPNQIGQCEFLVEGLREGLHVMDVLLKGTLEGLVAGGVEVQGRAAGSILVRNPNFSLAFSHPRTIRTGEPYVASVTILNTSSSPANLVTVTLPSASISGALLTSDATVALGDILPGQTATADFHFIAQRTGSITFSNFTSDDDVTGRFRLRMGVDERGVPLSPDSIGYPEFVDDLPTDLFAAADRVLGQALSIATAGQLPPGVQNIPNNGAFVTSKQTERVLYRLPPRIVQKRIVELAEAGQRLRYGDSLERVLADLLLDWQGAREYHAGFDQILKVTNAGRQWRDTIGNLLALEQAGLSPPERLANRAPDLTGRGERWWASASGDPAIEPGFVGKDDALLTLNYSDLNGAGGFRSTDGGTLFLPSQFEGRFEWRTTNTAATTTLNILLVQNDGTAQLVTWNGVNLPAGAKAAYDPAAGDFLLQIDANGDGSFESTLPGTPTPITELDPDVIGAIQDVTVLAGRPRYMRCTPTPSDINGKPHNNYGTIVGVLFSKPMAQSSVEMPSAYTLDGGNRAVSVAIQPGGRVALLNLQSGIGLTQKRDPLTGNLSLRQRNLTVTNVTDPRGGILTNSSLPIVLTANQGVAIEGRVVRADGSPAANVPVTLTYREEAGLFCDPVKVRPTQVRTNPDGRFSLDFVMSGVPYSLSATDTGGLSDEIINLILQGSEDDQIVRAKLLELASQPSVQGTLLEQFAVGALPDAIALVEGLDRALLKDLIDLGSARLGTETPVALRFRGRATVQGRVLASDGLTTVAGVAVNLFPDPASREKGRGVLTKSDGRFEFFGVPLGVFSLQAQAPDGTTRALSETLTQVGEVRQIEVVLSASSVATTSLSGHVYEADGVTPHQGATVLVGNFEDNTIDLSLENVIAVATTDINGFYRASGISVGPHDLVAISVDGKRRGLRLDSAFSPATPSIINITLQARAIVRGRVEFSDGRAAENAIVAGGLTLVRTDAGGNFVLEGVPTGFRAISAGLERNEAAGIKFPRLGSTRLEVVAGDNNFAVIRFAPRGSITGRVLTQTGDPVAGLNVALPLDIGSFAYTRTDDAGVYLFENIALQEWTVSAPAPNASNNAEIIDSALDTIGGAAAGEEVSQADLLGAITDAFAVFTGVNDPFLNGSGANFNPLTWGYTRVPLTFDGQVANADIIFLPEGSVSGTVINGQGVPIGARVRLTGIGPTSTGELGFLIRGERNSDPATGEFDFPGQLLVGPFGLQAANPFFPVVITHDGATNRVNPDATGILMQFPPVEETNGRLTGTVFNPDGTPAGEDINVKISFGNNFVIRTIADGTFDTQIDLPAGGYSVEAEDPATGLLGKAYVNVRAGITNDVSVTLLAKGDLNILVTEADGTPVPNANVVVRKGSFPSEEFDLITGGDGTVFVGNLFEGNYSVRASAIFGPTTIRGSKGVNVIAGQAASVTIMLQPTGTIRGTFLEDDGVTPVSFAQIVIGSGIGFATTDALGLFEVVGLPLGTYRLLATEPVSGRLGVGNASLTFNDQIIDLPILVRSLGDVRGGVLNSARTGFVAGAVVTMSPSDGLTPSRQVTTGPNGQFSFPGTVEGLFSLSALDPPTGIRGSVSGRLDPGVTLLELDVPLQALGEITITVFEPDGTTPANATVTLIGSPDVNADTNPQGEVVFGNLALRTHSIVARSMDPGRSRSGFRSNIQISQAGVNAPLSVSLLGVGTVEGTVVASDGVTPVENATLVLQSSSTPLGNETRNFVTGPDGTFSFPGVSVGSYQLTATSVALAASTSGAISANGETDSLTLILGDNGSVRGRLLRADGLTPVTGLEVGIFFDSQSGLLGVKTDLTAADGSFEMTDVPLGPFNFEALFPSVNGIYRLTSAISSNGQIVELGDLLLDEDDPRVVSVLPSDNALDVSVIDDVILTFNEEIDPASFDNNGIYLCDEIGAVSATLSVEDDGAGLFRVVRLHPNAPLESETTYHLVVLDGDRQAAGTGGISARGPRDLVGRPLVVPFQSSFVTEDSRPPELLSLTPADGSEQIDPRSVVRLSFDEAMTSSGIFIMLNGPGGLVAGNTSLGVNSRVAVFTPNVELLPNATYSIMASGFQDLAGNVALNQPYTATFSTLDTIGPTIADLRIKNGATPVASAAVELEVVLATPEPGARVRMTADFVPIGETLTAGDLDLPYTLPASGSVTIRAIAIDRFGNEGPFAETTLAILSNQPPEITITQVSPASGPLPTGSSFQLRADATDDSGVTSFLAAVTGAAEIPLQSNNDGSTIFLSGVVRPDAGPADLVTVVAQATDSSGESTPELTFEFPIEDGTPPAVTYTSPPSGTSVVPGDTLTLTFDLTDNFGVTEYDLDVTGAFTLNQTIPAGGATSASATFDLVVPSDVTPDGAPFSVQLTARDDAGLTGATSRSFAIADLTPPTLTFVGPSNGSTRQPVFDTFDPVLHGATIAALYDEDLDEASFVPGSIILRDSSGAEVSGAVRRANFGNNPRNASFVPDNVLLFGHTYTVEFTNLLTDLAGNGAVPTATSFTTVSLDLVQPVADQPVVEGQSIPFQAVGNRHPGGPTVRYSGPDGTVLASAGWDPNDNDFETLLTIPLLSTLDPPPHEFTASVVFRFTGGGFYAPHPFAAVTLDIRPRDEDSDNDGILNGAEIDNGLDPFIDDASEDPDADNLTNAEEIALGTDPLNPDTDGDGINDDVDPDPLVPMSGFAPVAGIAQTGSALLFDGVDDYIELGNPAALQITGPITLECCFKTSDPTIGNFQTLVSKWSSAGSVKGAAYGLFWTDTGLQFSIAKDNGTALSVNSGQLWNDDVWHHAVGTWDGNEVKLYVDGVLMASNADPGFGPIAGISHSVRIGTDNRFIPGDGDRHFNGSIDEVRIWNVSRNVMEIRQDARRRLTGTEPGLAGYWHFDEGLGDTTYDRTISINDGLLGAGTAAHMPAWIADAKTYFRPPVFTTTEDTDLGLTLPGTDPDGASITAHVATLPDHGRLFQTTDGTTKGPEISSPFGSALRFDGEDDYLQVGATPELEFADNFTIEAWLRPDGTQAAEGGIIVNREGEYEIGVFPDGTIRWAFANTNPGWSWHSTGFVAPERQWTHISVSYAGGVVKTYANGMLVETFTGAGTVGDHPSHVDQDDFRIGGRQGAVQFFQGAIDEVRVWNRVLNDAEIAAQYDQVLMGTEAGLVALFHLDERVGTATTDSSPNALAGTLGGGIQTAIPAWISAGLRDLAGVAVTDSLRRLIYEPPPGFSGPDPFRYFVRDPGEDSAETTATVNVQPLNQFPVATDDLPVVFQEISSIIPVLDNDSDPDGDPLDIISFTQPANGTVSLNPDGTFTYQPDPGFTGNDPFTYSVADREVWNRFTDFDEGTVDFSLVGNPNTGPFGFPVWQMEYTHGDGFAGPDPWYRTTGAKMMWDPNWFGSGSGLWAKGNDLSPAIFRSGSSNSGAGIAVVRWISPFDGYAVDLVGELRSQWRQNSAGQDAEIAVALHDVSTGIVQDLFTTTIPKPTANTSEEFVYTPVDLRGVTVDEGDELIITQRPNGTPDGQLYFSDKDLVILPASATNTATVTLNVQANERPVTTAPSPGNGLDFNDSFITVANAPELQITGDQTIEMWLRPLDFDARRNPWAKAYAGEGTMTQEMNGTINYFYGTTGGNSGSGGIDYTTFNSRHVLPLNVWTHIALVRDLTNGTLRWFFNGVLTNEADALFPAATAGINPLLIGAGYTSPYNGGIDEVRLWNVARSQAEIQATIYQRLSGTEPGLAGYWPLEEGSGNQTSDLSPSGNHGTLGGTLPVWVDSFAPFDAAITTPEDTDLPLALEGTDAEGDPLTAVLTILPQHGALYQTPDGLTRGPLIDTVPATITDPQRRVIYAPNLNFNGIDDLTYFVNDGKVDSEPGTFLISVLPVNDAPVAVDDFGDVTVTDVSVVTQNVFANDTDAEGDSFTVATFDTASAMGGTVADNGDGTFTYSPPPLFAGDDTFTYSLTDGMDTGPSATVSITVAALNTFTWNNPAGGNWNVPTNWTPNGVPSTGDHAIIDLPGDYTVTITESRDISVLTMGASSGTQTFHLTTGTFRVHNLATFSPAASYNQSAGILRGSGTVIFEGDTTISGSCEIRDPGPKINRGTFTVSRQLLLRSNCDFQNEANVIFNAPSNDFYCDEGSTFLNQPGALFEIRTDRELRSTSGVRGTLTNLGTFRRASGNGESFCEWTVDNQGTLHVQTGELDLRGGGSSTLATFDIDSASTLQLNSLTHSIDNQSTLSGSGTFSVASGTTNLSADSSTFTGSLLLTGGTLAANANLTLPGNSSLIAGILRGSGTVIFEGDTTISGSCEIRDPGPKINRGTFTVSRQLLLRSNCDFQNEATVIFNAPSNDFYCDEGSTFLNQPGALFEIRTDRELRSTSGVRGTLTNLGTFRRASGNGESFCEWTVDNQGTLHVQTGELDLRGGGSSTLATFDIDSASTLQINSLTHSIDNQSTLSGSGTFSVASGTTNLSADSSTFTGSLLLTGGTLAANANLTLPGNSSLIAGILRGSGTVIFEGDTTISGSCEIRDPGPKINRGTFTVSRQLLLRSNCDFQNEATVIFNAPSNDFYCDEGSTFLNQPGALFEIRTDRELRSTSGVRGTLTNLGTFRRASGNGESFCEWTVDNQGTLHVQTGELDLRGGGSSTLATFDIDSASTLQINSLTHSIDNQSTLSGSGTFSVASGTTNLSADSSTFTGSLLLTGGTLAANANLTLPGNSSLIAGILRGSGTVIFEGDTTISGSCEIRDPGPKINRGTFTVSRQLLLRSNCDFQNEATVIFNAPSNDFYCDEGSTFLNQPGALFEIRTDRELRSTSGVRGTLTNLGTFRRASGNGESFCEWTVDNQGILEVLSGELDFRAPFTQNTGGLTVLNGGSLHTSSPLTLNDGVLTGDGIINGNVINSGATIRPGIARGNITISGNFTQQPGGTLEMDIAGDVASGSFDTLSIGGTATLAGTYNLLTGAFTATPGETYEMITYASRPGSTTFDNVTGVTNQNGIDYAAMYLADRFTLSTAPTAPGPAQAQMPTSILQDDQTGYEQWLQEAFGPQHATAATLCGDLADPDGDGLCNLLEYAFGGNPLLLSPRTIQPAAHLDQIGEERYLCLTYYRRKNADLRYIVEGSSNLQLWTNDPIAVEEMFVEELTPPSPHFERVTVRWSTPAQASQPPGFLRLRVERILPVTQLPIAIRLAPDAASLLLSFPSEAGKFYLLEASPDGLIWSPAPPATEIEGTGAILTESLPLPAAGRGFFRFQIR